MFCTMTASLNVAVNAFVGRVLTMVLHNLPDPFQCVNHALDARSYSPLLSR